MVMQKTWIDKAAEGNVRWIDPIFPMKSECPKCGGTVRRHDDKKYRVKFRYECGRRGLHD